MIPNFGHPIFGNNPGVATILVALLDLLIPVAGFIWHRHSGRFLIAVHLVVLISLIASPLLLEWLVIDSDIPRDAYGPGLGMVMSTLLVQLFAEVPLYLLTLIVISAMYFKKKLLSRKAI
jgi:hypothetical protein